MAISVSLKRRLANARPEDLEFLRSVVSTVAVLLRSQKPRHAAGFDELRARVLAELPGLLRKRFASLLDKFRAGHIARKSTLYAALAGDQAS